MDVISQHFWATPPVTRTLFTATLIESVLVHSKILDGFRVIFYSPLILKPLPHIWRLFSPFLLTNSGLGLLFDLYFLYTYCGGLESKSPRFANPGDFFVYVAFLWVAIMLPAGFLLEAFVFTPALIMAFVHTYAQDNSGKKATFYIIQIPMEYLPWVMLLVTLVQGGWSAVMPQFCGIFGSHLYDFLTRIYPTFGGGRNYLRTPDFVRRHFPAQPLSQSSPAFHFSAPRDRQAPAQQQRSGFLPGSNSWSSRGSGRRLGGD